MFTYIRTPILSFDDLNESQQAYARTAFDWDENIEESNFVPDPCDKKQALHMDEFLRTDSGPWDAGQMSSAFSGYFLKLSKDGDECVVAYRHW
jgi:hypothetical protein